MPQARERLATFIAGLALLLGAGGCATAELRKELAAQRAEIERLRADVEAFKAERPQAPREARRAGDAIYAVPLGDSPLDGPSDAWVTLVEFSDFQCPFCARVQDTLHRLRERFGPSLRFVFKHNPLPMHDRAMPAALAGECAHAQGKFWPYAAALFENSRALDDAHLLELAGKVTGMDPGAFSRCVGAHAHQDRIDADQKLASRLGATGTPTFFVNGRQVIGAQPFESFRQVVEEELAKARESGIPAGAYYVRAVLEKGLSGGE